MVYCCATVCQVPREVNGDEKFHSFTVSTVTHVRVFMQNGYKIPLLYLMFPMKSTAAGWSICLLLPYRMSGVDASTAICHLVCKMHFKTSTSVGTDLYPYMPILRPHAARYHKRRTSRVTVT